MIEKVCEFCGKAFQVWKCREKTAKYCSRKCSDASHISTDLNCTCPTCGKKFHRKPYHIKKYGIKFGNYCSRTCLNEARKELFKGEKNHQYGLKGNLNASFKGTITFDKNNNLIEKMIYCPEHPFCDKNGRVREHRLVVEANYNLFDKKYFIEINGKMFLQKGIDVHHIDKNHLNNELSNLMPCNRSEHKKLHKTIITERDKLGRIVKTAVLKQGELLGTPEVDNQQPSLSSNTFEGSTTNSRILTDNAEDSNANTSALPNNNVGEDIV